MSEYKSKLFDRNFTELSALGSNATKFIIIWAMALVIILITGLLPKVDQLNDANTAFSELRVMRNLAHGTSSKSSEELRIKLIAESKVGNIGASQELKDASIIFKLPLFETNVKAKYAGLMLELLVIFLLIYAYYTRKNYLRKAAYTTRMGKSDLNISDADLYMHAGSLPWWARPLPVSKNIISPSSFSNIFGHIEKVDRKLIALFVFFIVLLILQFQAIMFTWDIIPILNQDKVTKLTNQEEETIKDCSLVLLFATLFLLYRWFQVKVIPDYFSDEVDPNGLSRREFVLFSCGIFISAYSYSPLSEFRSIVKINPRFRKKIDPHVLTNLSEGWYINGKSGISHRVRRNGVLYLTGKFVSDHFSQSPVSAQDINRPCKTKLSYDYEQSALKELDNGNRDKACAILLKGIEYSLRQKVSAIRLFDLLAGLSLRFNKDELFEKVIGCADKINTQLFDSRSKKWQRDKRWRDKWRDTSKAIKWAGVVM